MMECMNSKTISTRDLFPIIQENLSLGRKVKFTVSGNSMLPWVVSNRDQVILTGVAEKDLKTGDIILFQNQMGRYKLHRIIKKETSYYRTMGDSCLFEDGRIYPEDIIGVVEKIYRKGMEIDCNRGRWVAIFALWRYLLPIRKQLLELYFLMGKIKSKILKLWSKAVCHNG